MRYFGQGLFFLLAGLFTLSSCDKADIIGLDIDPGDSISRNRFTDFNVNTVTVRDDSVSTYNMSQYPLGSLDDPQIGTTDAGIAMQLSLPSSGFSFGTDPLIDSVVLVLRYGNEFYGDSVNTAYSLEVRELDERLGTSYSSRKEWNVKTNAVLGSKSNVRFAWGDSIRITQRVTGGPDTLVKVAPQLRVPLDGLKGRVSGSEFTGNFSSNTAFVNYFKGLYLKATKSSGSTGGIGFLNLAASDVVSRMDVFYRNTNSSGGKDTLTASFNVAGEASSVKHTYLPNVQTQLDNPTGSYSTVYVQAMGGLKTKVTFPDLKKLRDLGTIAINKAELVVNIEGPTNPLKPAPFLTLYQTDIAGQRQALPDQTSYWGGAAYDSSKNRYVFNIGNYVQGIVTGRTEQYPIYIISSLDPRVLSQQSQNIQPVGSTGTRAILAGKNSELQPSSIKLNIFYHKMQP